MAGPISHKPDNDWATYAQKVSDANNNLQFNPQTHPDFDGIVAAKLNIKALTDPNTTESYKYHGLRVNIAVLRDFIGARQPKHLKSIAEAIADALSNDVWTSRPFTKFISRDIAMVEGAGAAEIYKHLLEVQEDVAPAQGIIDAIKDKLAMPDRAWQLPPIEETPFGNLHLATPVDGEIQVRDQEQAVAAHPQAQEIIVSEAIVAKVNAFRTVNELSEPTREESVEEARKILRFLRNMELTERPLEEWLDQGTPQTKLAKKQSLQKLVGVFTAHMKQAQQKHPERLRENTTKNAADAAAAMALEIAEHTRLMIAQNDRERQRLDALIDSLPADAELRQYQSVASLLDTLEIGIERLSGRDVSPLTAAERLGHTSLHTQLSRQQIDHLDTLQMDAREESMQLARSMFKRMHEHPLAGKMLNEAMTQGTVEDKAAFAQQISEMVDMYRDMLTEAAAINPNILHNQTIKDSNDTMDTFAHAISLMAAKEIPSSIAMAQQISADITRMPERWGELHNHTVDRLVKSAEDGLEKAMGEIDAQIEQEQDQDEEMQQDLLESALLHSDAARRRKKRRKPQRTNKSGKKQRKQMLDLTADDYLLKQGRFAEESKVIRAISTPMQGLKAEDMEAIRKLGGNLRDIGQQLKDISGSMQNVQAGERISPDDKTAAQRAIERETQPNNNPMNPRGPRNAPRV